MKKVKKPYTLKRYNIPITPEYMDAIVLFVYGRMGINEFINLTHTNGTSSYSMIARGVRQLHKDGLIKWHDSITPAFDRLL